MDTEDHQCGYMYISTHRSHSELLHITNTKIHRSLGPIEVLFLGSASAPPHLLASDRSHKVRVRSDLPFWTAAGINVKLLLGCLYRKGSGLGSADLLEF